MNIIMIDFFINMIRLVYDTTKSTNSNLLSNILKNSADM